MINIRVKNFFSGIGHVILGIWAEMTLIAVFFAAGLLVCFVWWGFFR